MTNESSAPLTETARLAALYEVSQVLGASLQIDETLRIVMDAAIRLTGAERGFLMLFDPASHDLVFRVARNAQGETLTESQFEVSYTILTQVAQTGQSVVTTDAGTDPRFSQRESIIGFALRSILAVPLKARGELLGALYVDNKVRRGLFTQKELELLNTFANQAAVAIDNARLYTQTDQALAARVAELQTMQTIGRELNTALDLEKVAEVTLSWAINGTNAESGWIGLLEETHEVRVVATRPAGPQLNQVFNVENPLLHAALLSGEIEALAPEGTRLATLITPLLRDKRVTAVLVVEQGHAAFSAGAADFLLRLADQAAIALENARLYAAIKSANDAKTKFVSTVSHELRIPMTSIKGYIELLKMVGPINDQQGQFIQTIKNNVERMSVLVSDLSDISRIEAGRLKTEVHPYNLMAAVQETLANLRTPIENKQQKLVVHVAETLPMVMVDKTRLVQILTNLINNAHKYSPAEATITVAADLDTTQEGYVWVRISDTGFGISEADQEKLFSQFFRSEDPSVREQLGWGLGLHLTKRLVELLGGQISMVSTLGEGSQFTFTLPVVDVA